MDIWSYVTKKKDARVGAYPYSSVLFMFYKRLMIVSGIASTIINIMTMIMNPNIPMVNIIAQNVQMMKYRSNEYASVKYDTMYSGIYITKLINAVTRYFLSLAHKACMSKINVVATANTNAAIALVYGSTEIAEMVTSNQLRSNGKIEVVLNIVINVNDFSSSFSFLNLITNGKLLNSSQPISK